MRKKAIKKKQEKLSEPLKLDIACGKAKKEGFVGVDILSIPGVDKVVDLEKFPWPFKSDSVDEIFCSHYIEHTQDLVAFMEECYRILKTGGKMTIISPYYTSIRAWQDPTHKRPITDVTMHYFNAEGRKMIGVDQYPWKSNFNWEMFYHLSQDWAMKSEEARNFAIRHYFNVVNDIQFNMTKI